MSDPLVAFAETVGPHGPVAVEGGRTAWDVGGRPTAGVRLVRAPAGIVRVEPSELTVRVRAGTRVAELADALAEHGQRTVLPDPGPGATVGGVLAVGHSGVRRLGEGPVRDAVLGVTAVSADGRVVRAGGATVKNVSGYDLCRLLVGSLGTLGLLAEVILRTRPIPEGSAWLAGPTDPWSALDALTRPAAVLWDGTTTWALVEGAAADVVAQVRAAGRVGLVEVEEGPSLPPHRSAVDPGTLGELEGEYVAEVGVGTVHRPAPAAPPPVPDGVRALNEAVRDAFDPRRRLNPGRGVLA